MKITLTEKRFFEWHEDDRSVTLRNKSGSYGGGRKCWSFVSAADLHNHVLTGQISKTLTAGRMDPHHIPCVILKEVKDDPNVGIPIDVPTGEHKGV